MSARGLQEESGQKTCTLDPIHNFISAQQNTTNKNRDKVRRSNATIIRSRSIF